MKFYIETYGCQMNVSDSELVRSVLAAAGWEEASAPDEADLLLFNTCSVRQHAEDRVLGRISNEKRRKLERPGLKIGVLGCMAQRMGKRLLEEDTGIDFVAGVDQYRDLPRLLASESGISNELDPLQIYPGLQPRHQDKSCAFVTVMRGCDNFCSYCIVPYVRGRERSLPADDIYNEVRRCGEEGRKDVTLLGQNVNSYRYGDTGFPQLLSRLDGIDSIYRLRFITSHPKDLSDGLIDVMAGGKRICRHIHLPLQSGDDTVLRAMNRNYTYEHYRGLVEKLRKAMPDIAITTDIIAGFPGETDTMFDNTVAAMRDIGFDYSFCFKYSPREGTVAASLPDQVPEEIRLKRLQKIVELQREITLEKFKAQIGTEIEVYVEGWSRKSTRQVSGKTSDYKIAVLSGGEKDMGTLKRARVVRATAGTLICE